MLAIILAMFAALLLIVAGRRPRPMPQPVRVHRKRR